MMELTLRSGALCAKVSTHGGELISLTDESGFDYIWNGDPAVWKGRNPNLFPIVGKLKDGHIQVGDFTCEMPQHGLVRQREFQVLQSGPNFVEFGIAADAETKLQYPFAFLLRIRHTLLPDGFETQFTVENCDDALMPFCIGAHTGFTCPLEPGKTLEDYAIHFSAEEDTGTIPIGSNGLMPQQRKLPLKGKQWDLQYGDFDREDTLIFEGLHSTQVTLSPKSGGKGVQMDFAGWPMLAFWTKPHAQAPFLCIEPWQGCTVCENADSDFFHKRHCVTLEPGKTWQRSFRVTLV